MLGDVFSLLWSLAIVVVPAYFMIKLIIAVINWLNRH